MKAGFWNRTGVKALENFVNRAKIDQEQRAEVRRQNQLQKEMEKYEKAKKKQEEREAKAANKEHGFNFYLALTFYLTPPGARVPNWGLSQ